MKSKQITIHYVKYKTKGLHCITPCPFKRNIHLKEIALVGTVYCRDCDYHVKLKGNNTVICSYKTKI